MLIRKIARGKQPWLKGTIKQQDQLLEDPPQCPVSLGRRGSAQLQLISNFSLPSIPDGSEILEKKNPELSVTGKFDFKVSVFPMFCSVIYWNSQWKGFRLINYRLQDAVVSTTPSPASQQWHHTHLKVGSLSNVRVAVRFVGHGCTPQRLRHPRRQGRINVEVGVSGKEK